VVDFTNSSCPLPSVCVSFHIVFVSSSCLQAPYHRPVPQPPPHPPPPQTTHTKPHPPPQVSKSFTSTPPVWKYIISEFRLRSFQPLFSGNRPFFLMSWFSFPVSLRPGTRSMIPPLPSSQCLVPFPRIFFRFLVELRLRIRT